MEQREIDIYVAQVVETAEHSFGAHLSRALLESYAREAVLDLWLSGASITSYTAELALNQIHDAVVRRSQAFMAQAA
jgi:hypothetical protein